MFVLDPRTVEPHAARAAGWLRGRGLRAGDRVAVVARNHPGYVPFTLGALRSGVVPVLVNADLPSAQRDRIVADCRPALVVSDAQWPPAGDATPLELEPCPLARPMHYTSGTTGTSKGVWSGLVSDPAALAADERELWGAAPGDVVLVASPLYHSAPHRLAVSALLAGARVAVLEKFDVAQAAEALRTATGAFLVPTQLRRLADYGLQAPAARRILHAGEPCPVALKERIVDLFPDGTVWEFYGSTEGQFTLLGPDEWAVRPESVGRARPGRRLRIEDPGPDGVGRVWVTCPEFWRWAYFGDPVRTAQAWDGDAFTVGDLGSLDAEGFLYLAGRRDDLIITGGVNVYPAEVEKVLESHPLVTEAAVYGRPDGDWGQRVCAAVVVGGEVTPGELLQWARERLAPAQRPKDVRIVDELPRTATGKILRRELLL